MTHEQLTSSQEARPAVTSNAAFVAALALSLLPTLAVLVSAHVDWFDKSALLLVWVGAATYGFFRLSNSQPVPIAVTAVYWAVIANTFDATDKFEGYGAGESWLMVWLVARALIAVYLLWLLVSQRQAWLLLATVLFFVPVTNLPVDVIRNAVVHRDHPAFKRILVTKASASDIFGLHFDSATHVRWIRPREHGLLVIDQETAGLGGGTMHPQFARSPDWYRALLQRLLSWRYGSDS